MKQLNSNEIFKYLLDNAIDCVHIVNTKGDVIMCSDSFANSLGYSKDEALSLNIKDWDINFDANQIEDTLKSILEKPISFQTKHKRKDDYVFDVEVNAKAIEFDNETYIYASSKDITDILQLNTLKELQKLVKMGSWSHIHGQDKLIVSDEFRYIYGLDEKEEFTVEKLANMMHKDDLQKFNEIYENIIKKPFEGEFVYRIFLKDKTMKYIHIHWLFLIENGKVIGTRGYSRDITEEKVAKEKEGELLLNLEMEKSKKELALKVALIGVWEWDYQSNNLNWDKNMYMIYGFENEPNESPYSMWSETIDLRDKEAVEKNISNAKENNEEYNIVFRINTKDGKTKYIHAIGHNEYDENGNAIRMVGVNQDVTRQKELEEKEEYRQTVMLQQNRLAQLGEMVSMIAHQWRQPLTAIAMNKMLIEDILEENPEDKESLSECFETIDSLIEGLSFTIDDFRNFYKSDKSSRKFNVKDLVISVSDIIKGDLNIKSISLNRDLDNSLIAYGVEGELKQVILALLSNSRDAFEVKGLNQDNYINIKVYEKNKDIIIKLEDNAGGIPKKLQDKIFDPYFTTKEELNGTGIGLYMTKMVIENSFNGKISFESNDIGTAFEISIPKKEKI